MNDGGTQNGLAGGPVSSSSTVPEKRFLPLFKKVGGGWLGRIDQR